jgi:hypothetical protein
MIWLLFLLLAGCARQSTEDFQEEGESHVRRLTAILQDVHHRDELAARLPQLKKEFEELVDLMIAARHYQIEHPHADFEDRAKDEEFLYELQRIYRLEGGREGIEKAQREALLRLHAFEENLRVK